MALKNEDVSFMKTKISNNTFVNNRHQQNLMMESDVYNNLGSLIEFHSDIPGVIIKIDQNTVKYNYYIGRRTSLIGINGGVMKIYGNLLMYNGYLSNLKFDNHPNSAELKAGQIFPYSQYVSYKVQEYGVFSFYFEKSEPPEGMYHNITGNKFSYNFCRTGCAYNAHGSMIQEIIFEDNDYEFMIAKKSGAVFSGDDYLFRP